MTLTGYEGLIITGLSILVIGLSWFLAKDPPIKGFTGIGLCVFALFLFGQNLTLVGLIEFMAGIYFIYSALITWK